jgi:peptidoglycan-associated lipoprotein
MKKQLLLGWIALALCTTLTSCCRSRCEVWEDTKTCGRYMGKGVRSLLGHHLDSREYANYYEKWDEEDCDPFAEASLQGEFIPLADGNLSPSITVKEYSLSKESPGDPGSKIPGIEGFKVPTEHLAALFCHIHFGTDDDTIQGSQTLTALREISQYLVNHPQIYLFIEGHADERGAAAYNLALGSRRAHSIRAFLIENGVSPDRLFTISYGLERPIAMGHTESAWKANRRGQFKLYER